MSNKHIHTSELFEALKTVELVNSRKTKLEILNYGAAIFSLKFPDGNGGDTNVIVSPEKPEDFLSQAYKEQGKYFGASVGRFAGRISQGGFQLNGEKYSLYSKEGVHLHGGELGFSYKFWEIEEFTKQPNPSVKLSYLSKDGEEGYPGNLQVFVTYTLTEENEVKIEYTATTDKETVVNLTNHAYFNLNGGGDVRDHQLMLDASQVLEVDSKLIPSGNLKPVKGTEKDFTERKRIGDISLDGAFVLNKDKKEEILLQGNRSGINLSVEADQPAVVVYIPEDLPDNWNYQTEIAAEKAAICLESQNFPDAPNRAHFPSSLLKPGEEYRNRILWKFERRE